MSIVCAVKAFIRPRPVRVAYLVEENEHWPAMLDAIFAESFSRWGGRFTLIVPCEMGAIRPAYILWLKAYDPDLIYSFVDLDEAVIEWIHAQFGPAYLHGHDFFGEKERNDRAYRPRLPIDPLSAFSVLGLMGRGGTITATQPVTLVDTHFATRPPLFVQQNFGCYSQGSGPWPMGGDMSEYVKMLTLVPPEQANVQPRAQGDVVSTEMALLEALATQRNLMGLAQMSASFTPRLEVNHGNWSRTVNLVVGDSFVDRLVFWNALSLSPVWLSGNLATLKVSPDDFNDSERLRMIVNIIKNRIYFPIGGNVSFAQIVVRSASLPARELERIASKLQEVEKWNRYTFEHIVSIDTPVPPAAALQCARHHVEPGSLFQSPDWCEVKLGESMFRPPAVPPRHLRDTPTLPSRARHGVWQLDLDIQREVDHSGIQNVQHHWRLPRRLRMTGAFVRGYQLARTSPICMPRTTANGLLSIISGVDGTLPEIVVPSDESAFHYALCVQRDWLPFTRGQSKPRPGPVIGMRSSDKGRYLTAVLRMSGDIHRGKEIFLSGFWKGRFEVLGATPKATDERIAKVSERLRKRLKGGPVSSDEDRDMLAKLVLAEAREVRFPTSCLKFDELQKDFDAYRSVYWGKHPTEKPDAEWDENERRSLAASTQYLCQREILHQGYEWRCRQCFNTNWVGLDDIKRQMECEVCGRNQPAPVDHPWHFKMNGFVLRGLQEHGLLPLMWCLGRYADKADASFFYLPPHDLFFTHQSFEEGKSDSEVDLLMVCDGIVRMVEAKTSSRGIKVATTVELAKRIRPDFVVLAVMEEMSPSLQRTFEELQGQLKGTDINAELLTLESGDIDASPRLPTGASYRVRML